MAVVQSLFAFSMTAALVYLAAFTAIAVVLALRVGERHEGSVDDGHALSASRLTIPVSIVVPVASGAGWPDAAATIAALLGLDYRNFEVIVVADDLGHGAWDSTKDEWRLEAREIYFRASLHTAPIRMMYRSVRDPRLIVVHKAPASGADALNCGVNLARFRYVCSVDPGVAFDAGALSRAMAAPLRNPANVVGATSHVEIRGDMRQRLRSIRSLMDSRVMWRHLHAALVPRHAVVVWRRETVEHAGGFSTGAADPQLEMMIRLQHGGSASLPGQIVRTAELFGYRPPRGMAEDLRQTADRQRAAIGALLSWPKTAATCRTTVAYFFLSEVVTPVAQAWLVVATIVSAAFAWLPWTDVGWTLLLLLAGRGVVNAAAQLVRGAVSQAPEAYAKAAA